MLCSPEVQLVQVAFLATAHNPVPCPSSHRVKFGSVRIVLLLLRKSSNKPDPVRYCTIQNAFPLCPSLNILPTRTLCLRVFISFCRKYCTAIYLRCDLVQYMNEHGITPCSFMYWLAPSYVILSHVRWKVEIVVEITSMLTITRSPCCS